MGDIIMEIVQEKFDRKLKEAVDQAVGQAVEQAVEQAKEQEKLMEQISLVQKKCRKSKPLSVIADELETNPNELLSVYNIVFQNPDKTVDELYELAVK